MNLLRLVDVVVGEEIVPFVGKIKITPRILANRNIRSAYEYVHSVVNGDDLDLEQMWGLRR